MTSSSRNTGQQELPALNRSRQLSNDAYKKQLDLRHSMEAQLRSHGFQVTLSQPVVVSGFKPSFNVRCLQIRLNGDYLGMYNPFYGQFSVSDARLSAWCHIMGEKYYENQKARL
ncbi:hypothetical protein SBP1_gp076 [Vibrio virus vB_VspP_SBP1]|uniref:Uncharacterized protein n=1 Tax=Vibrio virus vB_VspP_SBP1 TaxID=2500581 RepID=A0A3T0IIM1_9CAUD|nr:hypothetical protein KNU36_gp053 [Vibrio virus vB_VspP_SBP1]AZU99668.1 hypothetical protein SBP1_gp076 [Vibrio virus vB_VspP_SBP1]